MSVVGEILMELLIKNCIVLIDDEDYEKVKDFKWTFIKYKCGTRYRVAKSNPTVYMHRLIMKCPKGEYVDHINGNGLDNRKINLRICSNAENSRNRTSKNPSGYKGVFYVESSKKWLAKITFNYKSIWLGRFKTKNEAALAYNNKAIELFGKFAKLNEVQ